MKAGISPILSKKANRCAASCCPKTRNLPYPSLSTYGFTAFHLSPRYSFSKVPLCGLYRNANLAIFADRPCSLYSSHASLTLSTGSMVKFSAFELCRLPSLWYTVNMGHCLWTRYQTTLSSGTCLDRPLTLIVTILLPPLFLVAPALAPFILAFPEVLWTSQPLFLSYAICLSRCCNIVVSILTAPTALRDN